jgi:hypothetical protein
MSGGYLSRQDTVFCIAETMGAKPVSMLFTGASTQQQKPAVSDKMTRRAREAGRKLAAP